VKPPPIVAEVAPAQRVLRNPSRARDVASALGRAGLLVIDDCIMPTIASCGRNTLASAAFLLSAAGSGAAVELEDSSGRRTLRTSPVSVIGRLDRVDLFWCHRLEASELAGTIFIDAGDPGPVKGDLVEVLTSLLRKVRSLIPVEAGCQRPLRLSGGARKMLDRLQCAADLPPLSLYADAMRDLSSRLAAAIQIVMWAAGAGQVAGEISADAARRAVELTQAVIWPEACRLLSTASVSTQVHSARRLLSYLQRVTSPAEPTFVRRALVVQWARSMTVADLDTAIAVLCGAGLLARHEGAAGVFTVNPPVYEALNGLPDLRVDPRKRGA